jgi:hypothetical protein
LFAARGLCLGFFFGTKENVGAHFFVWTLETLRYNNNYYYYYYHYHCATLRLQTNSGSTKLSTVKYCNITVRNMLSRLVFHKGFFHAARDEMASSTLLVGS